MPFTKFAYLAAGSVCALAAIVGTVWILSDDGGGPSPAPSALRVDGNDATIAMTTDGEAGSFLLGPLCTSGPEAVKILKVEPARRQGRVEISDFSAVPSKQTEGFPAAEKGRLKDFPQFEGATSVSGECPSGGEIPRMRLAVELTTRGDRAFAQHLKVTYLTAGRTRVVDMAINLGICKVAYPCRPTP